MPALATSAATPNGQPQAATAKLASDLRLEIETGLPASKQRRDDATYNLMFFHGDFSMFPPYNSGDEKDSPNITRCSLLMQRIINTLTANLYQSGPKRSLATSAGKQEPFKRATEWLNWIYRRNWVDAQFQKADALAAVADAAMFQVEPTLDPNCPIKIRLWDASQFEVWFDPDDQTEPIAIAVKDKHNGQRRCRLWTKESVETYLSEVDDPSRPYTSLTYDLSNRAKNPYGFLPFSFVHWNMPIGDFWCHGPGTHMRAANYAVNWALTYTGKSVRFNLNPYIIMKNTRVGWRPTETAPGSIWFIPPNTDSSGEQIGEPDASCLQADSSFVAASWDDLNSFLDHTLEMAGVPHSTIRMVQDSARSGVSIIAEQAPLILWAKSRQRPFACYEDDLAEIVLRLGARYLGVQTGNEYKATAKDLEGALADLNLLLRWPKMFPDMPGPERDTADQFRLDNALASRTVLIMERESMTREEAEAYLDEIAEDVERETELFGAVTPTEPAKPGETDGKTDPEALSDDDESTDNGNGKENDDE